MSRRLDPDNFTAEKLAWHRLVAFAPGLSSGAKALAGLILHDLNAAYGYAYRSQQEMAKAAGVGDRQIRNQIEELKEAGFLEVETLRGPKKTNHYFAVIPDGIELFRPRDEAAPDEASENRKSNSAYSAQNRKSITKIAEIDFRQSLDKPIKESRARKKLPAAPARPMRRFPDGAIRRQVVAAHGEGFVRSYLDQASWDPQSRTITCATQYALTMLRDRLRSFITASRIILTAESISLERAAA